MESETVTITSDITAENQTVEDVTLFFAEVKPDVRVEISPWMAAFLICVAFFTIFFNALVIISFFIER